MAYLGIIAYLRGLISHGSTSGISSISISSISTSITGRRAYLGHYGCIMAVLWPLWLIIAHYGPVMAL